MLYLYVLGADVQCVLPGGNLLVCALVDVQNLLVPTFLRSNSGLILDSTNYQKIILCGGSTSSRNEAMENNTHQKQIKCIYVGL